MNRPLALAASLLLASGAAAQCLSMAAPTTTNMSGSCFASALADLNGDGKRDLIVTTGNASVTVRLGIGDGTFGSPMSVQTPSGPVYIAVADLNNDGKLDMVVSCTSNIVSVYPGNGNGTFAAATNYSVLSSPQQIALADFNDDGKLDMAYAFQNSGGGVFVRLNNGNGTFAAPATLATGGLTNGVAAADFNRDGIIDLAATRGNVSGVNQGVVIFRGNGDGTFQSGVNTGGGGGTWIQIADLNRDSRPDLIVFNQGTREVFVQLGLGDGTFQPVISTPETAMSGSPWGCAVGDLDGDGYPDLAIPLGDAGKVGTRRGLGNGSFDTQIEYTCALKVYTAAIADLNGDGLLDILTANYTANSVSVLLNASPTTRFSVQPSNVSTRAGENTTISLTALNATSYQWYRDGNAITDSGHFSGATTASLHILCVSPFETGSYTCVATGVCNSATTNPAVLSIAPDCTADFNHDSAIDFFDYLDFVDAFSAGC